MRNKDIAHARSSQGSLDYSTMWADRSDVAVLCALWAGDGRSTTGSGGGGGGGSLSTTNSLRLEVAEDGEQDAAVDNNIAVAGSASAAGRDRSGGDGDIDDDDDDFGDAGADDALAAERQRREDAVFDIESTSFLTDCFCLVICMALLRALTSTLTIT